MSCYVLVLAVTGIWRTVASNSGKRGATASNILVPFLAGVAVRLLYWFVALSRRITGRSPSCGLTTYCYSHHSAVVRFRRTLEISLNTVPPETRSTKRQNIFPDHASSPLFSLSPPIYALCGFSKGVQLGGPLVSLDRSCSIWRAAAEYCHNPTVP